MRIHYKLFTAPRSDALQQQVDNWIQEECDKAHLESPRIVNQSIECVDGTILLSVFYQTRH